jgi:hypothetical protein
MTRASTKLENGSVGVLKGKLDDQDPPSAPTSPADIAQTIFFGIRGRVERFRLMLRPFSRDEVVELEYFEGQRETEWPTWLIEDRPAIFVNTLPRATAPPRAVHLGHEADTTSYTVTTENSGPDPG